MEQQQSMFKKKELVVAVGVALLSGVMSGCGSSGSSTPVAAVGAYTIDISGGTGGDVGGDGGEGGMLEVRNDGGTGGILVSATGKADASFTSPVPAVTADTGANPLVVSADTTILTPMYTYDTPVADLAAVSTGSIYIGTDGILYQDGGNGYAEYATDAVVADERYYTDGSELYQAIDDVETEIANLVAAGTPYRLNGDEIYLADGTAATADARVTGISVASGATLTLDGNGYGGEITVAADIANNGTITLAAPGNWHGLSLNSNRYIASGTIDNSGVAEGEDGGHVYLYAGNGIHNSGSILASGMDSTTGDGGDGAEIYLTAPSYIQNSGMLDAHGADAGADGSEGGYGGRILVRGAYVENSGAIDASGGDNGATSAYGGYGGRVSVYSFFDLNNSGNIDASMGDGGYGSSGCCGSAGSRVYLKAGSDGGEGNGIGTLRNSGNIDASGGDRNDGGEGSYGGRVYLTGYGGDVVNNGDINVNGGNGIAGLSDLYGTSGYAGSIYIEGYTGHGNTPVGDIRVSGNLSARGGDAAATSETVDSYMDAGYGGFIRVRNNMSSNDNISDQVVALYGYTSINIDGGDGARANHGGYGGFWTNDSWDETTNSYVAGSVVNEVDISAQGGNISAAIDRDTFMSNSRGYGGWVDMNTSDYEGMSTQVSVTNSGDIDVSGGDVVNEGYGGASHGGSVYLFGKNGATNSGAITANGGLDDGTIVGEAYGSFAGGVEIYSDVGAVANSGVLTVNGGNGDYQGGDAGWVDLMGFTVNNSGNLTANGGNASTAEGVTESYGGDGGNFTLFGVSALNAAVNSATLSYSAGTGVTPGSEGSAQVGIVCEGNCSGM
jgi:hypothetical protein